MLTPDYLFRPTARDCLDHPFFDLARDMEAQEKA
jgi:hypothetical protein